MSSVHSNRLKINIGESDERRHIRSSVLSIYKSTKLPYCCSCVSRQTNWCFSFNTFLWSLLNKWTDIKESSVRFLDSFFLNGINMRNLCPTLTVTRGQKICYQSFLFDLPYIYPAIRVHPFLDGLSRNCLVYKQWSFWESELHFFTSLELLGN